MKTRERCESCGSEMLLTIKKEGRTIEIIKHYRDCPQLLKAKELYQK